MKRPALLHPASAVLLCALLLSPGLGAAVCAMGADCGTAADPVAADPAAHCAAMAGAEQDSGPEEETPALPLLELDCCFEPGALHDPVPALGRSSESTALPAPVAPSAVPIVERAADSPEAAGARSSPDRRSAPPLTGADLRVRHQSFLN